MRIRCLLMMLCVMPYVYTQESATPICDESAYSTTVLLQSYATPQYIAQSIAATWIFSQTARALGNILYSMQVEMPISQSIQYFSFSTAEEQGKAHVIVSQLESIVENNFLDTSLRILPVTENNLHAYNTSNEHILWVAYDEYNITGGPGMLANTLFVTPRFLELPSEQQQAILIHEYTHYLNSDVIQNWEMQSILNCSLLALSPLILHQDNSYWNKGKDTLFSIGAMLFNTYAKTQLQALQEIESDVAAADHYEDAYTAFNNLFSNDDSLELSSIQKIALMMDPHQTHDMRYAYMKHYAEYGQLPWYIKVRPAYWLGNMLRGIHSALSLFNTPTDYIVDNVKTGYQAAHAWWKDNNTISDIDTEKIR